MQNDYNLVFAEMNAIIKIMARARDAAPNDEDYKLWRREIQNAENILNRLSRRYGVATK